MANDPALQETPLVAPAFARIAHHRESHRRAGAQPRADDGGRGRRGPGATFGFLREIGCDQVQGFLISRPMNREAIATWMGPPPVPRGNGSGPTEAPSQSAVA